MQSLITNMEEAIRAYPPARDAEEPIPSFIGIWNFEVVA
jgi:hypothetical protein